VADDPFVSDEEMPYRHNPIRNLPWLDTKTELEVFQHRAGQSIRLAEWCEGEVAFTDQLVVRVPGTPPSIARLGDFVVTDGERYWVEPADGFFLRYWPTGRDPGWSHRCYMNWEEQS
jgi:hypothetical protein